VRQYRFLGVILCHLGSVALASALANSAASPTPSVVVAPNGTLSPLYSDLSNFPATLLVTSTRDPELSATAILHRAFLRAGVEAQLVVFEALPHAFWHNPDLPESKEADQLMATFFDRHLIK
jgi:acetyl esterase/lipase